MRVEKTPTLKTKQGAASFYIVIFTTLLLSILTMSFIRIMLAETSRTTNDDLAQSAYDSALAGVEDAKIAIIKYYECKNDGHKAGDDSSCGSFMTEYEKFVKYSSCDLSKVLGRLSSDDGSTTIQEVTDKSSSETNSSSLAQAYTCVKINDGDLDDYETTLSDSERIRVIPLQSNGQASDVRWLSITWSGTGAEMQKQNVNLNLTALKNGKNNNQYAAPIVVDFYQTDTEFTLGDLSVNSSNGTDHASIFLQPTTIKKEYTEINESKVLEISDKSATSDHSEIAANCTIDDSKDEYEYTCRAKIQLPPTFKGKRTRAEDTFILRIENPYGVEVNVNVSMLASNNDTNTIAFSGVQAVVDSTGRANDLYRRVEARIDLSDTTYPYPEFALQLNDDSNSTTSKNFYVTNNCWYIDSGVGNTCPNSKEL